MKLVFRIHAIQRMSERQISVATVKHVLEKGEIIRDYPDDTPYPSRLILGWREKRPLHVVAASGEADQTIIITAYEPDADLWEADFRKKK